MNHIEATIQCGTASEICAAIQNCQDEAEYPRLGIDFDYDLAQGSLSPWQRSERWSALVEAGKELHVHVVDCSGDVFPDDDFHGVSEAADEAASELYSAVWTLTQKYLSVPNDRIVQAMRVLDRYFESYGEIAMEKIFDDLSKISRLCGPVVVTDNIKEELL